jgi:hypothetical protein
LACRPDFPWLSLDLHRNENRMSLPLVRNSRRCSISSKTMRSIRTGAIC